MRALRTIPVLIEMCHEMERVCPSVVHLNYVNPMAMNCWALSQATKVRTIGLCQPEWRLRDSFDCFSWLQMQVRMK
jgi:alpha-galactosidase/6-phospho-beta-glucosidase family protein